MLRRFEKKTDGFWKDLIIQKSIYEFNCTKIAPTLDMLLQKLKKRSAGADMNSLMKKYTGSFGEKVGFPISSS